MLELKVQPRASQNQFVGLQENALKIKLTSPPVDGAANKMCRSFLAKQFSLAKSSVELVLGETSRHKVVLLKGLSCAQAQSILAAMLEK